jgi:REP-associated tyrosine transposase
MTRVGGRFGVAADAKHDLSLASSARTNVLVFMVSQYTLPAMLLGWHLFFTTYGFWPPNDPRGSGSTRVRTWHLYDAAGEATKVNTRHSVSARPHDMSIRRAAKEALKYPPVELNGLQARAVARGITEVCPKVDLVIHACAIMPNHVHVIAATHQRLDGDDIIACLKRAGTRGMNDEGLHPMAAYRRENGRLPTPWAGRGWKVKIYTARQMRDCFGTWSAILCGRG